MTEDTVKEHKHSKKRRHEHGTDERSEKKRKKSKNVVLGDKEVENMLVDDTPTAAAPDATVPNESSPEKRKKKKKKHKHKERSREQHEDMGVVAETNEDSGAVEPIEPQSETEQVQKDKSKKKEKSREDESIVEPQDAASSHNPLDGVDVTEPTQPEKKKKKDKTKRKSKDGNGEDETEVVQQQGLSKSTSALQNLGASNSDDILQAFQQLDFTRLQGALGDLDLQSFGLDIMPDENDDHSQPTNTSAIPKSITAMASGKRPVADVSESSKKNKRKRVVDLKNLIDPNAGDPHSNLLATKWLTSKELRQLADTQGLVYKKGKFSFTESHAVKTAIEQYRTRNGMTEDAMIQFIFAKHHQEHKRFWTDIALAVPGRPLQAVYHHIKLAYNPLGNQGKWIPAEDAALRRAVADLGSSWSKISERIGRTAQDCKDRWRNHLSLPNQQFGKWSQEEIDELTNIVRDFTVEKGKDLDSEIYWKAVSEKMGGKRSREQCRDKWKELKLKMDNEITTRRWSNHNTYILLQRMAALSVNDDSEIVWKDLIHGQLNLWTPHRLQSTWRKVEKSVPDYENMAYKDILASLLERYKKYAESEPAKKNLKFPQAPEPKSAEIIEDSADEQGSDNDD